METDFDDPVDRSHGRGAPRYSIPTERVVSVEHPCIIRNFERGLKSLGGESQLKHVLEYRVGDSQLSNQHNPLPEPVAGVSLRPEDPFAKKLTSAGIETRNVLFRVTLPKRTGRKRKRGSDGPFIMPGKFNDQDTNITAPKLLKSLRDNEGRYVLKPIAMLQETHRFRTLPDFQLRASQIPAMRNIRQHAMIPEYDRVSKFAVDLSPNSGRTSQFPPPPSFTSFDIAQRYEYQQAAGIIVVRDEHGKPMSRNLAAARKRLTWELPPDVTEVPQGAPPQLPRRSGLDSQLQAAIHELEKLLNERPLVTKRVALNALPPITDTVFKEATQWVGYSFKAGPWRDSLIRYGVDPRSHPQYRIYQTLMFKMDKEAFKPPPDASNLQWTRPVRHTRDDPSTHIFDGKSITANGKTWQMCDITDPVLAELLATAELREECDMFQWGWYHNGTIAKVRVIMRDKMRILFAGKVPPEEDYKAIAALPNKLHRGSTENASLPFKLHGERLAALSNEMRSIAKSGDGLRILKSGKSTGEDGMADVAEEDEQEAGHAADAGELIEDNDDDDDDDRGDFAEMDDNLDAQDEEDAGEGAEDEDVDPD